MLVDQTAQRRIHGGSRRTSCILLGSGRKGAGSEPEVLISPDGNLESSIMAAKTLARGIILLSSVKSLTFAVTWNAAAEECAELARMFAVFDSECYDKWWLGGGR